MSGVLSAAFSVVVFLLVIGAIVLVHEMGHYLVGRLYGFAIEAFSIGFGPKLLDRPGRRNRWQLRWILVGGYVKFVGEMDNPDCSVPEGIEPASVFSRKPRWQRFLVLVAGVAFNVFAAYLLFAGLAWYGVEESITRDRPALIGLVAPGSPAEQAGLRRGDRVVSVDSRRVKNWQEAEQEFFTLISKPYPVTVLREGRELSVLVTPQQVTILKQPMGSIGVFSVRPAVIGAVGEKTPAMEAGLRPGDVLLEVEGAPIEYWDQLQQALADNAGTPVHLKVRRGQGTLAVDLAPRWDAEAKRYLLGVLPQETTLVRYPFPACLGKAGALVAEQSTLAFRTFAKLLERKMPISALSGPPTLAYISGEVARTGLYNLLFLLGVISVQIGIFNLLPVPGLDGGHVFVLAVESVLRRDLPLSVKEWIMRVGFGLLIVLFAAIVVLDIAKFF